MGNTCHLSFSDLQRAASIKEGPNSATFANFLIVGNELL